MHERSSKSEDENEAAFRVDGEATGERPKNEAAVALGRLGGLKGGKARADSLSAQRRKQIAKNAAAARWRKK